MESYLARSMYFLEWDWIWRNATNVTQLQSNPTLGWGSTLKISNPCSHNYTQTRADDIELFQMKSSLLRMRCSTWNALATVFLTKLAIYGDNKDPNLPHIDEIPRVRLRTDVGKSSALRKNISANAAEIPSFPIIDNVMVIHWLATKCIALYVNSHKLSPFIVVCYLKNISSVHVKFHLLVRYNVL